MHRIRLTSLLTIPVVMLLTACGEPEKETLQVDGEYSLSGLTCGGTPESFFAESMTFKKDGTFTHRQVFEHTPDSGPNIQCLHSIAGIAKLSTPFATKTGERSIIYYGGAEVELKGDVAGETCVYTFAKKENGVLEDALSNDCP